MKQQLEAALRQYPGLGPLKINLFTPNESKLIEGLTLKPGDQFKGDKRNTDENIENVQKYVRAKYLERGGDCISWLRSTISSCGITMYPYTENRKPIELDEEDAKKLLKLYALPDKEVDLIGEALNNPKNYNACGDCFIGILPEAELSFINNLVVKCGIENSHPVLLAILSPALKEMKSKIDPIMIKAGLDTKMIPNKTMTVRPVLTRENQIALHTGYVQEFKETYFTSIQPDSSKRLQQ